MKVKPTEENEDGFVTLTYGQLTLVLFLQF